MNRFKVIYNLPPNQIHCLLHLSVKSVTVFHY